MNYEDKLRKTPETNSEDYFLPIKSRNTPKLIYQEKWFTKFQKSAQILVNYGTRAKVATS